MPSFHIFKSSAGSGKTSQLVLSYLKLCLGSNSPTYYRKVLAITFTNKASNEMKERLIKELEAISSIGEDEEPNYMVKSLLEELNIDVETLRKRAKATFKDLLQAYEQVSISTIDKFNHTLIKSFSRELDIPSDFEVETGEKEIFSEAVDELISRVGTDKYVTRHLINFVQYKLDEESKVNIHKSLEDLYGLCIGEASYQAQDEIGDIEKEAFERISKNLQAEIKKSEAKLHQLAESALKLIDSAGLSAKDFSYGEKGVYGFFKKIKTQKPLDLVFSTRAQNALDGSWMPKNASPSNLEALNKIQDDLHNILLRIQNFFEADLKTLNLKQAVRSNIDLIAVLNALYQIFKDLCYRKRVIPISRFNKLISDALRKEPVSFIYEQIGARYDHILIDEFQDTSQLQWYNLVPLIDEAISRGKYNMVVGDAKQSIYRWRGGKAEQLIALPNLFEPPLDIQPEIERNLQSNSEINRLQVNYRSLEGIVKFNNEMIGKLASIAIPPDSIYGSEYSPDSFKQKYRESKKGGYIQINELEESNEKADWNELIAQISLCIERGYNYSEMAILVRSARKEGKSITRTLLKNNIPVVSKESYDIGEYQPVKIILAFLKLSLDSNHNPSKIQIMKGFGGIKNQEINFGKYTSEKNLNLDAFLKAFNLKEFESYNHLSVFDAVEAIQSIYFQQLDHPAVNTLKEVIYGKFGLKGTIRDFFDYWENQNDKPGINFGDTGNSIELLTIHKAKGLEYKVIFIPELAWKLRPTHNEIAWFSMKDYPLPLPYAPLKINKKLAQMGLEEEFKVEENANKFDNLNLIYVALTRAEEVLFINTYKNGSDTVGFWMAEAIENWFEQPTEAPFDIKIEENEEGRKLIIGELAGNESANNDIEPLPAANSYSSEPWKSDLKFANVWINQEQSLGNIFHDLVSKSFDLESFQAIAERKTQIGLLSGAEKDRLLEYGRKLFTNETFSLLLKEGTVFPEREILHKGKIIRPDLVVQKGSEQFVLDFKTGGNSEEHKHQIREYMEACEAITPGKVSGYLIYLDPFELVQVEQESDASQMKLF